MALLHPSSAPAALPELNLFTIPPTQTAVEGIYEVQIRPISQITGGHAPVEFNLGGEGPDYIDLSRSKVKVKLKIVHADATSSALAKNEAAVPVNLALHSLWNQVDVSLGGRLMTQATGMYPYKSMIQTLLNYGKGAKETQLLSQGFYKEEGKNILVFGMGSSKAFNGDYKKNPFRFQHFNVTDVAVVVNGETVPGRPLKLKFDDTQRDYISGYLGLFEGTGRSGDDFGNGLTPADYADGYTLFVYNLDPDLKRGNYLNLVKRANIRLELRFASALPSTIKVVVYAEHPALFEVDRARNVMSGAV
jgi:hypothetical protein